MKKREVEKMLGTYMVHEGDDVAGHDGCLCVDGVAKQVVQCRRAAVFKDEVHNANV